MKHHFCVDFLLCCLLSICIFFNGHLHAQPADDSLVIEEFDTSLLEGNDSLALALADTAAIRAMLDSMLNAFEYQTGTIELKDGLATLQVPAGYKYLEPEQSRFVLVDLWGNPPSSETLGLLFLEDANPFSEHGWVTEITYDSIGYVKDDNAKKLDYEALIDEMRATASEENAERTQYGYPPISLIGWAVAPFYDAENRKLHWAQEIQFGIEEENTLNYNIRILGRRGVLVLNAISEMSKVDSIKNQIPALMASVSFNEGHRYQDFDVSLDKVAAYGIGGLIAGKALVKIGLLAKILKFWKFIVAGLVGFFLFLGGKFFGKGKKEE